ncbi:DUF1360 domain-containing protein [Caldibacillus lycopersici]|uniref:DUF1360 domain-containing protein n=1 Tax=Perspicuibacillus lycopersici TaxID=1325689 RepID=A0AAE3IQQ2_9BACI|nr:DUF1360 domain-containing protein [Perspicuibacillus lycopersici]MCU9612422.1 DUF1360 domain-containing protein [Perspicuibacillus lycopersici]
MSQFDAWSIILIALAAFRLTRLIVFDKITEFIRAPFFDEITELDEFGKEEIYVTPKKAGIKKWIGELLSCYWCTGIWVSIFLVIIVYFYPIYAEPLIIVLAVAAIAAIIESVITHIIG